jgi:hypothetical protein
MTSFEVNLIKHDIDVFLESNSLEEYNAAVEHAFNRPERANGEPSVWQTDKGLKLQKWFRDFVEKDIIETSGRWVLEELGMVDVEHGMTNNASEAMNSLYRENMTPNTTQGYLLAELHAFEKRLFHDLESADAGFGKYQRNPVFTALQVPIENVGSREVLQADELQKHVMDLMLVAQQQGYKDAADSRHFRNLHATMLVKLNNVTMVRCEDEDLVMKTYWKIRDFDREYLIDLDNHICSCWPEKGRKQVNFCAHYKAAAIMAGSSAALDRNEKSVDFNRKKLQKLYDVAKKHGHKATKARSKNSSRTSPIKTYYWRQC